MCKIFKIWIKQNCDVIGKFWLHFWNQKHKLHKKQLLYSKKQISCWPVLLNPLWHQIKFYCIMVANHKWGGEIYRCLLYIYRALAIHIICICYPTSVPVDINICIEIVKVYYKCSKSGVVQAFKTKHRLITYSFTVILLI